MKIQLQVEIIGDNSVAWCKHSVWYTDHDAREMQEMVNNLSELKQLSFHKPNGELVVLGPELLKKAVVTVEIAG